MTYDTFLVDRIREALRGHAVKEVEMYGGLSFKLNDELALTVNNHGHMMVRCDPETAGDPKDRKAANWTGMKGRELSDGWVRVKYAGYEDEEDFKFWIDTALSYNRKTTAE